MRAVFPKTERAVARLEWDGGFFALTPVYTNPERLPHDLSHYAVDAVLRPRYGFWELAAQRAPFTSLQPCRPWPKDRLAWFAGVLKSHRDEMVEAERFPALLSVAWPEAQRLLKSYWSDWPGNPRPPLTGAMHDSMRQLYAGLWDRWRALPLGKALDVEWPPPAPAAKGQSKPTKP
jgi:hypothetical protein